jgi:hypothetical protein
LGQQLQSNSILTEATEFPFVYWLQQGKDDQGLLMAWSSQCSDTTTTTNEAMRRFVAGEQRKRL